MMDYRRIGVASTFSPRFFAVLAEADCFASHVGAELEIIHAASEDEEKEKTFQEALEKLQRVARVRWAEGATPSEAIMASADEYQHDLVMAGALEKEGGGEYLYAGRVARALLAECSHDLLLMPHPMEDPSAPKHVVFPLEAGEQAESFLAAAVQKLRPARVTLLSTDSPFSNAMAASLGKDPPDPETWIGEVAETLADSGAEIETRVVSSTTGFVLCEAIQGLEADLLVVRAPFQDGKRNFPAHIGWLTQIIPMRLLVTAG